MLNFCLRVHGPDGETGGLDDETSGPDYYQQMADGVAGRISMLGGPDLARGPEVADPWSTSIDTYPKCINFIYWDNFFNVK